MLIHPWDAATREEWGEVLRHHARAQRMPLLGPAVAKDLKKQVGQDVDAEALSPRKRKGQLSLDAPRFRKR